MLVTEAHLIGQLDYSYVRSLPSVSSLNPVTLGAHDARHMHDASMLSCNPTQAKLKMFFFFL